MKRNNTRKRKQEKREKELRQAAAAVGYDFYTEPGGKTGRLYMFYSDTRQRWFNYEADGIEDAFIFIARETAAAQADI